MYFNWGRYGSERNPLIEVHATTVIYTAVLRRYIWAVSSDALQNKVNNMQLHTVPYALAPYNDYEQIRFNL